MLDTIILDEAQSVCNYTSKRHKAVKALPAKHKYMFSGSPMMNSPMDLFSLFRIIRPEVFPNFLFFVNTYMYKHPTFGYILGARTSKLKELGEKIRPYLIKRTLQEVCPQMPPHIDETIRYELSSKEAKLYSDIKSELLLEIQPEHIDLVKNPISLQNALTKLQKLSELTDSADLIGHSGIPSTKLELLKDKVDEVLAGNNRKLIVYSWFARRLLPQLLPLMAEYNPVYIVGGMDAEENRIRFKTDPTCRVLILSTAGSEALSFEEASYLIRLDTPFSIGRNVQLTGRIRRITSEEPTFSYTLAAKGTVDEHMLKILDKKKLINSSIFGLEDLQELLS
jgi:SNF2 family DNA or RNA helicase